MRTKVGTGTEMKAIISISVTYDSAACGDMKGGWVKAALEKEINSFISRGGLTPQVADDESVLVVDDYTSHVSVGP